MNGVSSSNSNGAKILPPPTFNVPADFDNKRYELWTVRMPVSADLQDLNGLEINLKEEDAAQKVFVSQGQKYTLQWGHAVENESFRLLLPREGNKDSDSDDSMDDSDDDKDEATYMYPTKIPFQRHVNIVTATKARDETELAPRIDNAPVPDAAVRLRRAYQPVAQKTGLKRRWMPLGTPLIVPAIGAAAVRQEETPSSLPAKSKRIKTETPAASVKKEEPEAIDEAKRSAKKMKKEAKKMKKEKKAKKVKKEA